MVWVIYYKIIYIIILLMQFEDACKIFVGNVPFQCTKDEFIECFKTFKGFIDGDIINKYNSNNSRGFGFIKFDVSENTDNFLNAKVQINLKGRNLRFTKYMPLEKKVINGKFCDKNFIFIKNVPKNYKPNDIKTIFEKYGYIGSCFINTDINTGDSKGTAVVEILDSTIFKNLLQEKYIILDEDNSLQLSKWKQKIKIKKQNNIDIKDVYRLAFNAGRNMGFFEGIKIGKVN